MNLRARLLCAALAISLLVAAAIDNKNIRGRVLTTDGEPMRNVLIALSGVDLTRTSSSDGTFRLNATASGDRELTAEFPGYETVRHPIRDADVGWLCSVSNCFIDIELRMKPSFAYTGSIAGEVVSEHGSPRAGIDIEVSGSRRVTSSRRDGTFMIYGVAAGSHVVTARIGSRQATPQRVVVESGATAQVRFTMQ